MQITPSDNQSIEITLLITNPPPGSDKEIIYLEVGWK